MHFVFLFAIYYIAPLITTPTVAARAATAVSFFPKVSHKQHRGFIS